MISDFLQQLTTALPNLAPTDEQIIERIVLFNNAWHALLEMPGYQDDGGISPTVVNLLAQQKGLLQAQLIRRKAAYLAQATDKPDCWSVRLNTPVRINGVPRVDACHMPKWVAQKLLLPEELAEIKG